MNPVRDVAHDVEIKNLSNNCKHTQGEKCLKYGKPGNFEKCCQTKATGSLHAVNQVNDQVNELNDIVFCMK